ncbi:MAG: PEP-CTERM sorting domain-containing protein [Verrucomicrobiota bacterium JB022]|nr:PEP-CTERM sorting domain-containing protein [Verrucomicrobiota bacterium JB022]
MKLPQCLGLFRWSSVAAAVALLGSASTANAELFAYEGFDNPTLNALPTFNAPDATDLSAVASSGYGFSGGWTLNNKTQVENSKYYSAGLQYPSNYPGSFTAVGGHGVNAAGGANSAFRLNFSTDTATAVNSASKVYISFLGQRQGQITPETGLNGLAAPGTYMNPYPRPAGFRIPHQPTNNDNGALGLFGTNGNNAENNGWGAWGFKDANGVMSGADVDSVDFIVAELDMVTSTISFWVNPQVDGTSDGYVSFVYADGGVVQPISMYAFGVEAGSGNAERAPGEWAFDEIRIGDSWQDVAGFTVSGPVVPEPSTYAAFAGVLALGLVVYRRRRS